MSIGNPTVQPYIFSDYAIYAGSSADFSNPAVFNDALQINSTANSGRLASSTSLYLKWIGLSSLTIHVTGGPLTYEPSTAYTCYVTVNNIMRAYFVAHRCGSTATAGGITYNYNCEDKGIRTLDPQKMSILIQEGTFPFTVTLVPLESNDKVVDISNCRLYTQPVLNLSNIAKTFNAGANDLVTIYAHVIFNGIQKGVVV